MNTLTRYAAMSARDLATLADHAAQQSITADDNAERVLWSRIRNEIDAYLTPDDAPPTQHEALFGDT